MSILQEDINKTIRQGSACVHCSGADHEPLQDGEAKQGSSASVLPEACKCCTPSSESEQAQRPVITLVKGLQCCSDSLPKTPQASPCDALTSKPETDMSGKEARGLKLALLVDLQQLDTNVAQLLGEALLATDKRHCRVLCAALRNTPNQAIALFLRAICQAAGHDDVLHPLAPDQLANGTGYQDEDESNTMSFSKTVSSYFYYCQHSTRFQERSVDRRRHINDLLHILREVVQDVIRQVSASDALDGKAMPDSKADEYLKEWVNAEEVRQRCIIPERHGFRDADAAKHALDVYGRIIEVPQFIQDTPLLAHLSHMIIRDDLAQHHTGFPK
ncbi:MAG: hypothetical protein FRX49_13334 [Trebouxia sp. A1-2]|nr:MAG: hypothetical protein FRX49_13334 [Trebouxia sp. A1-2]